MDQPDHNQDLGFGEPAVYRISVGGRPDERAGGFNTMTKIGKLPVKWGLELHYYAIKPDDFGPQWNLRLIFSPVIPKPAFSKRPIFGG